MSAQRIMIRYGGRWERSAYVDGEDMCIYMPEGHISRDNLLHQIQNVLCSPPDSEYMLFYFTRCNDGRSVRVALLNDDDLFRLIGEQRAECLVFVIERERQHPAPPVNEHGNCDPSIPVENEISAASEDEEEERRKDLMISVTTEFVGWIRQPGQLDKLMSRRNFSSDCSTSRDQNTDGVENAIRNWVIPVPDYDSVLPLGWIEPAEPICGQLVVGATFRKKIDLKIVVGLYHMENKLECATDRSSLDRLVYVCKQGRKNCTFRLCAVGSDESLWRITKLNLDHVCHNYLDRTAERQVSSKVAATYFARKLVDERVSLKPKEMISELRRLYGIQMDYSFALRTRNLAIDITYGDYHQSYQRLPSYLHVLKERNPGTFYDIETTREGVFCHMFVALGQCIRAFQETLRPVIVIDGTHLKGKNSGILFVAVTKDGNEGVFPLAVGIGPIENDESWTWFLRNLRKCYNPPGDLLIVSDQHKSIQNAIQSVYPNAARALCFHHLQKNLTRYGSHVASIFKNAAYCYRVELFEKYLSDLELLSADGAYRRLVNIGVETWAKAMCTVRRYSFMTSNAAESMNARLLWARRLPVCALLEVFRSVVQQWFEKRRMDASTRNHDLTEVTFAKLSNAVELSRHLTVRESTTNVFRVEEGDKSYHVDLESRTCDCREFELDQIPCRHAAAAIRRPGLSVYDFVSPYFKQRNLIETYVMPIMPLPHYDDWIIPPEISSIVIHPPVVVRQAGRPRMSRARSEVENVSARRRVHVCSRCNGIGHNKRACTTFIPIGVDLNVTPEESGNQQQTRRRQKKRCSICRSEDHTKIKCPMSAD